MSVHAASSARYAHLMTAEQDIAAINRAMSRGYEYLVESGILKVIVMPSHAPPAPTKEQALEVANQPSSPTSTGASSGAAVIIPKATGLARIGLDESGKSDYFGPLVIGTVYVDRQTEQLLLALGVRDSKCISATRILILAEEIKHLCPYSVVQITPTDYRKLYEESHNANAVLAWGHARALENMLERVACPLAIADQFGEPSILQHALLEKGRQITLEQRPRAEEDVAVAAASILARAEFLQQMDLLSKQVGFPLPKGSDPQHIIPAGRKIVERDGRQALDTIAKTSIKTTKDILQSE